MSFTVPERFNIFLTSQSCVQCKGLVRELMREYGEMAVFSWIGFNDKLKMITFMGVRAELKPQWAEGNIIGWSNVEEVYV